MLLLKNSNEIDLKESGDNTNVSNCVAKLKQPMKNQMELQGEFCPDEIGPDDQEYISTKSQL